MKIRIIPIRTKQEFSGFVALLKSPLLLAVLRGQARDTAAGEIGEAHATSRWIGLTFWPGSRCLFWRRVRRPTEECRTGERVPNCPVPAWDGPG
jgi:hypothetical protein